MAEIREMGIPFLRRRTGQSEEAREYNKIVEAISGLYESRVEKPPVIVRKPSCGFAPIPIYEKVDGERSNGVGLVPGKLRFLQTAVFYPSPTDDNNAIEIVPKLNNVELDADPRPHEDLADGDFEAWCIFREIYQSPEARIEFRTLGTGPGVIDRDEKCVLLCTFEVTRNGEHYGVTLLEQKVSCELAIWTNNHQFRCFKTDNNKIKIERGNVMFLNGQSDPLVAERFEVPRSDEVTITESGSIWLDVTATVRQHSSSMVDLNLTAVPNPRLRMYRVYEIGSATFTFRGASVNSPNPPDHGNDDVEVWGDTSLDLHYEICRLTFVDGDVFITDQIAEGPVWVSDLVDGKLEPDEE